MWWYSEALRAEQSDRAIMRAAREVGAVPALGQQSRDPFLDHGVADAAVAGDPADGGPEPLAIDLDRVAGRVARVGHAVEALAVEGPGHALDLFGRRAVGPGDAVVAVGGSARVADRELDARERFAQAGAQELRGVGERQALDGRGHGSSPTDFIGTIASELESAARVFTIARRGSRGRALPRHAEHVRDGGAAGTCTPPPDVPHRHRRCRARSRG